MLLGRTSQGLIPNGSILSTHPQNCVAILFNHLLNSFSTHLRNISRAEPRMLLFRWCRRQATLAFYWLPSHSCRQVHLNYRGAEWTYHCSGRRAGRCRFYLAGGLVNKISRPDHLFYRGPGGAQLRRLAETVIYNHFILPCRKSME